MSELLKSAFKLFVHFALIFLFFLLVFILRRCWGKSERSDRQTGTASHIYESVQQTDSTYGTNTYNDASAESERRRAII